MIRAGLFALVLAGPAAAQGLAGHALCAATWAKLGDGISALAPVTAMVGQEGDWCVVESLVLDMQGDYLPDWHMDRLRFRGSALGWFAEGTGLPERLEVSVEGLRLVVQTGNAQFDWLYAAQARAHTIEAEASLSWDAGARVLRLERLSVDFPGANLVEASALVTGVNLSSDAALQMTVGGFAITEADLRVTTHGLFEGYLLLPLGPSLLPSEGDMEAAAEVLRDDLRAAVTELPAEMLSEASKAALTVFIGELPNPSGNLVLSLRAEPGIGPARLAGPALTGVPETVAEAAELFQGVTVDVAWIHADAP